MILTVKHYKDIEKYKWDEFVYNSSMGYVYYLYDMIPYHRYKSYKNLSFAIVDEDENIYMVMQLHKIRKHLKSQWGFAIKDNLTKKQTKLLKQTFQDFIDSFIAKYDIKDFTINLPPLTKNCLPEKHNLVNPVQFYNFKPSIRYTYIVDLSKDEEKILRDCEETTRQAIRKYNKSGQYTVVESSGSKEDCETYINLHKETYTRTNATKHIIHNKYNTNIFTNLIPNKICKVFFLKDNATQEYVASIAVLIYEHTAYYWWGASKNEKDIGINKYLLFKVILIIRRIFNGVGYFETGGAYPYLREGKYKGLNDFKKCFGTILHPIFTGNYAKLPPEHKVINIFGIKIKYKNKPKTLMRVGGG